MPDAVFSALKPNQVARFRLATADFAEMTTIHPLGNTAIREAAAVRADFPVIAAADPLGGAAIRQTAAVRAANQFQRFHHDFSGALPNC